MNIKKFLTLFFLLAGIASTNAFAMEAMREQLLAEERKQACQFAQKLAQQIANENAGKGEILSLFNEALYFLDKYKDDNQKFYKTHPYHAKAMSNKGLSLFSAKEVYAPELIIAVIDNPENYYTSDGKPWRYLDAPPILHSLAKYGKPEWIQRCLKMIESIALKNGKNPKEECKKFIEFEHSAMHYAIYNKDAVNILKLFNQYQINPDKCDGEGYSPLHIATRELNCEAMGYLLSLGADPLLRVKPGCKYADDKYYTPFEILFTIKNKKVRNFLHILQNSGETTHSCFENFHSNIVTSRNPCEKCKKYFKCLTLLLEAARKDKKTATESQILVEISKNQLNKFLTYDVCWQYLFCGWIPSMTIIVTEDIK